MNQNDNLKNEDFLSDFDTSGTFLTTTSKSGFNMTKDVDFTSLMIKMSVSLIIVIVLIYLIAWVMKRILPKEKITHRQYAFEILSVKYLGPRKNLTSVRVNGRVLILGVTNNSINCLTEFMEDEDIESFEIEEDESSPDELQSEE